MFFKSYFNIVYKVKQPTKHTIETRKNKYKLKDTNKKTLLNEIHIFINT